jgi:hypothetical protein
MVDDSLPPLIGGKMKEPYRNERYRDTRICFDVPAEISQTLNNFVPYGMKKVIFETIALVLAKKFQELGPDFAAKFLGLVIANRIELEEVISGAKGLEAVYKQFIGRGVELPEEVESGGSPEAKGPIQEGTASS